MLYIRVYIPYMYLYVRMCILSHEVDQICSLVEYSVLVFHNKTSEL